MGTDHVATQPGPEDPTSSLEAMKKMPMATLMASSSITPVNVKLKTLAAQASCPHKTNQATITIRLGLFLQEQCALSRLMLHSTLLALFLIMSVSWELKSRVLRLATQSHLKVDYTLFGSITELNQDHSLLKSPSQVRDRL